MELMRMYLVKRRQELDMSMNETSRVVDMDFHHYRRIEQGNIDQVGFLLFCRIAHALGFGLDEILEQELIYQQERKEWN
jgi:transcriptional regulator with XRE-family HTH domain